jgi:3-hydroxyanthranilate 3,4-dioxygenase
MLIPHLKNFNLNDWINEIKDDWGQRAIRVFWESADYVGLVSRGPTKGKDFHVGPGDEIFYQITGDLHLNYINKEGNREVVVIRPGELFLLPAKVPHAPRRPDENSWTLVIERRRRPDDLDYWIWFCERCNKKLYETPPRTGAGPSNSPNSIIRETNDFLKSDESIRTCAKCGEVLVLSG